MPSGIVRAVEEEIDTFPAVVTLADVEVAPTTSCIAIGDDEAEASAVNDPTSIPATAITDEFDADVAAFCTTEDPRGAVDVTGANEAVVVAFGNADATVPAPCIAGEDLVEVAVVETVPTVVDEKAVVEDTAGGLLTEADNPRPAAVVDAAFFSVVPSSSKVVSASVVVSAASSSPSSYSAVAFATTL
jgi:hypothetical protein